MSQIFVDTWAWYALVDAGDADHETARLINERLLDEGFYLGDKKRLIELGLKQ